MFQLTFEMLWQLIGPSGQWQSAVSAASGHVALIAGCHQPLALSGLRLPGVQSSGETFRVRKTIIHSCAYAECTAIREKVMYRYTRLDVVEVNEIACCNSLEHLVPQVYGAEWDAYPYSSLD